MTGVQVSQRSLAKFMQMDAASPMLRRLINLYGHEVVHAFRECGVNEQHIEHLIETVYRGARNPRNKRAKDALGARRILDQALFTIGANFPADWLINRLWTDSVALVPLTASRVMVDASIAETGNLGLVGEREKHQARLDAAIRAGAAEAWSAAQ
ncbi:MAG: hypothetical protein EBR82_81950 [Caulobacteraceae bacterium]|nr:hypothetical protein [Caulobacteraceae bacterium]